MITEWLLPQTADELAAVRGFVEHMVYHRDHVYDRLTVADLRARIDTFLQGFREADSQQAEPTVAKISAAQNPAVRLWPRSADPASGGYLDNVR